MTIGNHNPIYYVNVSIDRKYNQIGTYFRSSFRLTSLSTLNIWISPNVTITWKKSILKLLSRNKLIDKNKKKPVGHHVYDDILSRVPCFEFIFIAINHNIIVIQLWGPCIQTASNCITPIINFKVYATVIIVINKRIA